MWKPKFNPVTRRRFKRFATYRRSYWSFWVLVSLYVISLLSEFICNDRPLYLRYEGESYFPVFNFYPDTQFTNSGLNTRPNYKEIAKRDQFAKEEKNFMIFAPIPFGPYETLNASDVVVSDEISVEVLRVQRAASLNVNDQFLVERATGIVDLFGLENESALNGKPLSDVFVMPDLLKEAVLARFSNNRDLDRIEVEVNARNDAILKASLSRYRLRNQIPNSVRLTLREKLIEDARIRFSLENGVVSEDDEFWLNLSEENRQLILDLARLRLDGPVSPLNLDVEGVGYRILFDKQDVRFPFPPTSSNLLGLDNSGRDVLARILYALRISLNFGLVLVGITMAVGVAVGGYQGYKGGRVDIIGQRAVEIWESLPFLYIMIMMGSLFGRSFLLLMLIYGAFNWIGISYYVRGEFLKLRKQPFVEAAHCLGLSSTKIMWRHILPNSLVPVITFFPFSLVGAIFSLSALDFLGFGLPPPTPSWGELLSQAQEYKEAWWLVLYPSLALFIVILLGVFIGEGVRAAFDPRVNSKFES